MKAVVSHFAADLVWRGEPLTAVLVLYPTYPFRSADQLSDILAAFTAQQPRVPLLGFKQPRTHPYRCFELDAAGGIVGPVLAHDQDVMYRRQDYPDYYESTHWACVVPVSHMEDINSQLFTDDARAYRIPSDAVTVDIDTMEDLQFAHFIMENRASGG